MDFHGFGSLAGETKASRLFRLFNSFFCAMLGDFGGLFGLFAGMTGLACAFFRSLGFVFRTRYVLQRLFGRVLGLLLRLDGRLIGDFHALGHIGSGFLGDAICYTADMATE